MQIKLLAEGGSMKPGPALSQTLGPAGINISEVIKKVNEATSNFKGMKVPVELDIDAKTKAITVNVFSPPVSELVKKELGIEKGSGEQDKIKVANASIEQIISVAKTKLPNLLCRDLKSAVKTVVGSCVSLGILVESKSPVEVEQEIDEGKYDKEINEEITETPEEKKKQLQEHFKEIEDQQQQMLKKEEAQKAEKDAKDAKRAEQAATLKPEEPSRKK
jgi:large subunit ribosomal protein L11